MEIRIKDNMSKYYNFQTSQFLFNYNNKSVINFQNRYF